MDSFIAELEDQYIRMRQSVALSNLRENIMPQYALSIWKITDWTKYSLEDIKSMHMRKLIKVYKDMETSGGGNLIKLAKGPCGKSGDGAEV